MPWLPLPTDHCHNAEDVREQYRHISNLRRRQKMPAEGVWKRRPKTATRGLLRRIVADQQLEATL